MEFGTINNNNVVARPCWDLLPPFYLHCFDVADILAPLDADGEQWQVAGCIAKVYETCAINPIIDPFQWTNYRSR